MSGAICAIHRESDASISHSSQVMIKETSAAIMANHFPYYGTFKPVLKLVSINNMDKPKKSPLEPSIDTFKNFNRILDTSRAKGLALIVNSDAIKNISILDKPSLLQTPDSSSPFDEKVDDIDAMNYVQNNSESPSPSGNPISKIEESPNQFDNKRSDQEEFESQKKPKTFQELVPLEDKILLRNQRIIRETAISLSSDRECMRVKHHDFDIRKKRAFIQLTLCSYLAEEVNHHIHQMPWNKINNQGLINWPNHIKVQDIERIDVRDLDSILENLDRIRFSPKFIEIIKYGLSMDYDAKRGYIFKHFQSLMHKLGMQSFRVPWHKIKAEYLDEWPENIPIKMLKLYKREELDRITNNLHKICFNQLFLKNYRELD